MVWNNVIWALSAALVLALLGTAAAWFTTRRRRRAHAELLRGAVAAMCAQRPDQPGRVARLGREVVDVLARQEKGAALLDSGRHQDAERLVGGDQDMALLVAADASTAAHPLTRTGNRIDPWQATDGAPRVTGHPALAQLCSALRRTTENRISRAQLVLAQAKQIDDVPPAEIARVKAALDRGLELLRHVDERAAAGDTLEALTMLTHVDLPVPEDGVPGQADAAEFKEQTNALARLALLHREALNAHRGEVTVIIPKERP
ncbi:hypothetical protein ABZ345_08675 [Lentzea sp. NPDC005914]|uniref:hypothetical protein n=1 Tax=Lentzea sp. NPDC005914 TaxID=3154572 RepID=UPI00340A6D6C